jgi:hypothetical protein
MKSIAVCWSFLNVCSAFQPAAWTTTKSQPRHRQSTTLSARRRTLVKERTFDPLNLSDEAFPSKIGFEDQVAGRVTTGVATTGALAALATMAAPASAAVFNTPSGGFFSQGSMDPANFKPICPASDGVYRLLQASTEAVVGQESFMEYGPLISGGLLRIRLELCVVESFFNEAVVPFVEKNGVSWILPFHETVETFLAGTIFALAGTFILVGSTKILTVLVNYADLLIGAPSRLFGGFFYDRAIGKPVTLDVGLGPFKTRLVGPPEEEISLKVDPAKQSVPAVLVVVTSGTVKFIGEFSGVSAKCVLYRTLTVGTPLTHVL